jgi:hypothetical protein
VLEKTAVTAEQLHDWTGDAKVMQLVDTLSHRDNESLQEYLARCAADPVAYFIKRLDLADKLDDTDDSTVPRRVARKIERETRERLALLDRLAGQTHDIRGNAS